MGPNTLLPGQSRQDPGVLTWAAWHGRAATAIMSSPYHVRREGAGHQGFSPNNAADFWHVREAARPAWCT